MLIRVVSAMFLVALLTGPGSINGLAESIREKSCENELAGGGRPRPRKPCTQCQNARMPRQAGVRVAEQSKATRPEAKGKAEGAQLRQTQVAYRVSGVYSTRGLVSATSCRARGWMPIQSSTARN
jgi:hypothetical protein